MPSSQQPHSFATTHWSLVLAAGRRHEPESAGALRELCQAYWGPVYLFVRRQMRDLHEAQDLTQAFFAQLLEKNALAVADPSRGRFRSFLLTSVRNFLSNQRDRQKAHKRGGGRQVFPFDFATTDSRYPIEPADRVTPERQFEREWALALLDQVTSRLRQEHVRGGKENVFDALKAGLAGDAERTHAEIAAQLGISENAAKVAAHRLRKRYRELLRAEVAQTLADAADIDDEIRQLFAALSN